MRIAFLLAMASVCAAQTSVAPPWIGMAWDCTGKPHRVYGIAGAFVLDAGADLRPADPVPAVPIPLKAGLQAKLPSPHGALREMGPGWLAAWPYAIRVNSDGPQIYRLPAAACGVRP